MNVQFRPLHEDEIYHACQLMRDNIPEQEFNQTIFAANGYLQYLQAACKHENHSITLLIGAFLDEALIGFAEWRRLADMLVLNNLHVAAAYQRDGIGRKLMAYGEQFAMNDGVSTIALDVFSWNEHVHAWYIRLGFVEKGRTYWYVSPLDSSSELSIEASSYIIEDYPMAEAHHQQYGFSSLRIRTKQRSSTVGRLGEQYFRILLNSGEWGAVNELKEVLFDIDCKRQLLLLSRDPYLREKDPNLMLSTESIRMIKSLSSQEVSI